jgi:hypothetical protein
MIVRKIGALFECIRDRCKRTGTDTLQCMAKQPQFADRFFNISLTVLLLRALMREFARVLRAIIHGAVQLKKLLARSFY